MPVITIVLLSLLTSVGVLTLLSYRSKKAHRSSTSPSRVRFIREKTTSGRPHTIIIFDTDTTGLPSPYAHEQGEELQLVQLAWCVLDSQLREIKRCNRLVSGATIPPEATAIHGLTTEDLAQKGLPAREVLLEFLRDWDGDSLLVAHNLAFDRYILEQALKKTNATQGEIRKLSCRPAQRSYCTMVETRDLCQLPHLEYTNTRSIPHRDQYKYPRLGELHAHLFGYDPTGDIHDAVQDLETCLRCFRKLVENGNIRLRRERS